MSTESAPWYADVNLCRPFLQQSGMDEAQYVAAIGEVRALMSLEEAKRQRVAASSFGAPTLHPHPGHHLEHNPIPLLLASDIPAFNLWIELVRLGVALFHTRGLPGIQSKRALLLNADQYRSTVFEIEALADFVTAGLRPTIRKGTPDCVLEVVGKPLNVEMRLGEARFGAALFYAVAPPFHDDFGAYQIRMEPGVGGRGEKVHEIARAIKVDIERLYDGRAKASVSRTAYTIDYSPTGARELSLSFGPHAPQTYAEMLEAQVSAWLTEKDDKLLARTGATPSLIALDVRALVGGLPRPGGKLAADSNQELNTARRTREHREAIMRSIREFVTRAKATVGVLAWWRKLEWELSLGEQLFQPWEMTLSTKMTHEDVPSAGALPTLFQKHLLK